MAKATRVLSGMRPTGALHIGNFAGALSNWVRLQNEGHECFFFSADWHALTEDPALAKRNRAATLEMAADWLAAGLDPKRSTLFVQSGVPEHAELALVLGMLVTMSRLVRVPTFKERVGRALSAETTAAPDAGERVEETYRTIVGALRREGLTDTTAQQLRGELAKLAKGTAAASVTDVPYGSLVSLGYLGYPVLQSADILIYRADAVPVGEDQVSHIELTRELARRFNGLYGEVFPLPEPLLTRSPRVPGQDGKKMSKSAGNHIALADEPDVVAEKVRRYVTDPRKIRKLDPGRPEICPVFALHETFNAERAPSIAERCRAGELGCVEDKGDLAECLVERFAVHRERRREVARDERALETLLAEGTERASEEARRTMERVREAMSGHLLEGGGAPTV